MKTTKSSKLPLVESALVVIALGLIGFVAFYVWNAKHMTDEVLNQANKTTEQATAAPQKDLTVVTAKLPAGWTTNYAVGDSLTLENKATQCSTYVQYLMGTAKTQAETVKTIQSQGYTVTQISGPDQMIMTQAGRASVPAQSYRITRGTNSFVQSYGFAASGQNYVSTQLTCPRQSDITAAATTLQAITVNHEL